MARSKDPLALEGARTETLAAADEFRRAAGPAVDAALHRLLEALVRDREEWFEGLTAEVRAAFEEATDRAIAQGVEELKRRLANDDLWLDPLTAPGLSAELPPGWDGSLPEWLVVILRRLTPKRLPGPGELDDLNNRVWIALLAAATPLDPVLEEFGLAPSEIPDLGGGNYGLAPKSAAELDPTGTLVRLWDRYRVALGRYRAMAGRPRR